MKKFLALFLALLMLALVMPMTALALPEDTEQTTEEPSSQPTEEPDKPAVPPTLNVSVTPGELVESGDVTVYVEITNSSSVMIEECMLIIDGEAVKEYGNIPAGSSVDFSGQYRVADSMLGADIPVQLTYSEGVVKASFKVAKKEASIDVYTTVKVDSETVTKGGKSTFTIAVENRGDAAMENVTITADALNGGKPLANAFRLEAGKAEIVTYAEVLEKDVTVEPVLTFMVAGKEQKQKLSPVGVKVIEPGLEIAISVEKETVEPDEEFVVSIKVKNTGNSQLTDIEITDADGAKVPADKDTLNAGESFSAQKTMKLSATKELGFTVKAKDAGGNTVSSPSNVITMQVGEAKPEDLGALLRLELEYELLEDKKVKFKGTIFNDSEIALADVLLTLNDEDNQFFRSLGAGEKAEFEYTTEEPIEEETEFVFALSAKDPDGNIVKALDIEPLTIMPDGEQKGGAGNGIGTILIILAIVIVLIVGVVVAIIILQRKDKLKKQEEEAREEAAYEGINVAAEQEEPAPQQTSRARIKPASAEEPVVNDMSSFGEVEEEKPSNTITARKVIRRREFDDRNNF